MWTRVWRRRPSLGLVVVGLLLAANLLSGCVSLARTETGSAPEPAIEADLRRGASLAEVLALCGVPLETIVQPDGLLLIYRARYYDFKRMGFEPALLLGLVDFTGFVRAAFQNIKLVLEWGQVKERRLVILFDEEERVLAYAYRDSGDAQ